MLFRSGALFDLFQLGLWNARACAFARFIEEKSMDLARFPRRRYTPFVRLALARWQGSALVDGGGDLRLSPIVTTDITQLSPPERLRSHLP